MRTHGGKMLSVARRFLNSDDDAADVLIDGANGNDTAYFDEGIDPGPVNVENQIPA